MKIDGYSDYEIYPETGQIWSYKTNKFMGAENYKGYIETALTRDDGFVWKSQLHRIIWTAVNGEIPEGMQVNHIDENKKNNSISNLNLMTCIENIRYGTGIKRGAAKRVNNPKKSEPIVSIKNGVVKYYPSMREAERNGFYSSYVCKACKGLFKEAYGHKWQYVDDYLADWWDTEMDKYMEKEKSRLN